MVDEIGVGAGVVDRLKELSYDMRALNGGRAASDPRFANLRAQAFWSVWRALEEGRLALPRDGSERLAGELTAIRWHQLPTGKLALEAQDELRGRLGRSPDVADALAQSFAWEAGAVPRTPTLHY